MVGWEEKPEIKVVWPYATNALVVIRHHDYVCRLWTFSTPF